MLFGKSSQIPRYHFRGNGVFNGLKIHQFRPKMNTMAFSVPVAPSTAVMNAIDLLMLGNGLEGRDKSLKHLLKPGKPNVSKKIKEATNRVTKTISKSKGQSGEGLFFPNIPIDQQGGYGMFFPNIPMNQQVGGASGKKVSKARKKLQLSSHEMTGGGFRFE